MPKKSIFFIIVLCVLDQLSKYVIAYAFLPGASFEVVPFFRLTYATNTGIAFSLFQNSNTFFIIFASCVLALLAYWYIKSFEKLSRLVNLSLVLIFAGALGNLLDRIFRGHVVDFLDFNIGSYHWPSFNLADSCITIGGIILFLTIFAAKKTAEHKES